MRLGALGVLIGGTPRPRSIAAHKAGASNPIYRAWGAQSHAITATGTSGWEVKLNPAAAAGTTSTGNFTCA